MTPEEYVILSGSVSTDKAWCFRFAVPQGATRFTVMRPYWIVPPEGRSRELTDDEIVGELTRVGLGRCARLCIAVCNVRMA